jgi:membrane-associated protease RseP (regulator of RpoE activity)
VTTLVDCPDSSRGQWRFRLFGIPVRVHPWFWLTILIMGANQETGAALIWIGVCFVSILLHELGHVWAFHAFGSRAQVVLYGFGGMAIPDRDVDRSTRAQVLISVAGPAADFCLAGVVIIAALLAGAKVFIGFRMYVIPTVGAYLFSNHMSPSHLYHWNVLINDLLFVNFYWGLMNLLPVYPLDGGQAARALFERADPSRGRWRSLIVSAAVGAAVALFATLERSTYLVLLFGILAASSVQMLGAERRLFTPRPYREWRR